MKHALAVCWEARPVGSGDRVRPRNLCDLRGGARSMPHLQAAIGIRIRTERKQWAEGRQGSGLQKRGTDARSITPD